MLQQRAALEKDAEGTPPATAWPPLRRLQNVQPVPAHHRRRLLRHLRLRFLQQQLSQHDTRKRHNTTPTHAHDERKPQAENSSKQVTKQQLPARPPTHLQRVPIAGYMFVPKIPQRSLVYTCQRFHIPFSTTSHEVRGSQPIVCTVSQLC